ncbi:MAG: zinc ribbon domain-containing protein [Rhodospirillaceae bacterium]
MRRKHLISPETASALVMRLVTVLLAAFLIMLADQFMEDLGAWIRAPDHRSLTHGADTQATEAEIAKLAMALEQKEAEAKSVQAALAVATRDYAAQKETYDNWLRARTTVGSPGQDAGILDRARTLDQKMAVRREWADQLDQIVTAQRDIGKKINSLRADVRKQTQIAEEHYRSEVDSYELKMFALRMAVVLPFLIFGIYTFVRWRKSRYRALAWGYIIFSCYAFFFGVVPYLPSYGGYLRYTIGIFLTVAGGIYAIRGMQSFAERKRQELLLSSAERAKTIDEEAAITSFRDHRCPSCDHDYTLPKANPSEPEPSFCYHCGLQLYGACISCTTFNFVHFNHCKNCGAVLKVRRGTVEPKAS